LRWRRCGGWDVGVHWESQRKDAALLRLAGDGTKNQASYERRVAQRRADLDDLTRLKA